MADRNKHIDDLFREGLDDYQEMPGSDVWASLEQRLSAGNNNAAVAEEQPSRKWLWYLLLLMLLATIGYFVYRQVSSHSAERGKINEATGINTAGPSQAVNTPPVDSATIAASVAGSYTGEGSPSGTDETAVNGTAGSAEGSDNSDSNPSHRGTHRKGASRASGIDDANGDYTSDNAAGTKSDMTRSKTARTGNNRDEALQQSSGDVEPANNSSHNRTTAGKNRRANTDSPINSDQQQADDSMPDDQSSVNTTAKNKNRRNNNSANDDATTINPASSVAPRKPKNIHVTDDNSASAQDEAVTGNRRSPNSGSPAGTNGNTNRKSNTKNAGSNHTDNAVAVGNPRSSYKNTPGNPNRTTSQNVGNPGAANNDIAANTSSNVGQSHRKRNVADKTRANRSTSPVGTNIANNVSKTGTSVASKTNAKPPTANRSKNKSAAANSSNMSSGNKNRVSDPETEPDSEDATASYTAQQKASRSAKRSNNASKKQINDDLATETGKDPGSEPNLASKGKPITVNPSQFKKGNLKFSDVSFDKDELATSEEHFKPNNPIFESSNTPKMKTKNVEELNKPEQKESDEDAQEGVKLQKPEVEDDNFPTVAERKPEQKEKDNGKQGGDAITNVPNETPSRMLLATGSNPAPVSKDGPATNNGGSGGGGGGGSDTKPKKNSERFNFAGGIKAAYERGTGNVTNSTFIFSPYLEWVISSHVSFVFQPGFRYNSVNKNNVFDITKAYHSVTSSKLTPDHHEIFDTSGTTPIAIQRNYIYSQTYDSIIIGTKLSQKNYWEVELPIMLKYQLSPSFAILGGLSLTIGNLIKLQEDRQTLGSFTKTDTLSFPTAPIQNPPPGVPTADNYFSYNTPDIGSAPATTQSASTNPARLGLMLGFSYEFSSRVLVDVMYKQTISDMKYIPNEQVRKLYTQPYFRVSVGMKLFGPQKKEPKNPAGL